MKTGSRGLKVPPVCDVYGLIREEISESWAKFLAECVDVEASDVPRQVALLPEDSGASPDALTAAWEVAEWVQVSGLSEVLALGSRDRRSFAVFLEPKPKMLYRASAAFTIEGDLVLGVSLDSEGEGDLSSAWVWMQRLMSHFPCVAAFLAIEEPPPLSQAAFRIAMDRALRTVGAI
jgi:hypothetical protein